MYRKIVLSLSFASVLWAFSACSQWIRVDKAKVAEEITRANSPLFMEIFHTEFVDSLNTLPKEGSLDVWYSNEMYNFENDGLAMSSDSQASPIAKYDAAFRRDTAAENWEKVNHGKNAAGTFKPGSWWGHCHGIAASTILHKEPLHGFVLNGVHFSAQDVKALLGEVNFVNHGKMAGTRCEEPNPAFDENGVMAKPECRDLNPATLHLVVGNYVGRLGRTPIIDLYPDQRVWSAVVRAFRTHENTITRAEAKTLIGFDPGYSDRVVSLVKVSLDLTTVWKGDRYRSYDYVLELDASGSIIGGEWYGKSKSDHPDFIWYPSTGESANPYVQRPDVLQLLSLSRE
jgi:hypothetical protein